MPKKKEEVLENNVPQEEESKEVKIKEEETAKDAEKPKTTKKVTAKKTEKAAKAKAETKPAQEKEKIDRKHGKKYRAIADVIEKGREYTMEEAIELLRKTSLTKFDSTVEIHVNLNVDPSNAEHQVRGSVLMPAGLGRDKKVAVIANVDKEKEAKEAGADVVGGQDLVERIQKGWLDFDVLVATPDMMAQVGKIGKILGTKGLMPNPKTGTVTPDVARIVKELKKGRSNYKIDKSGIIHSPVGKISFKDEDLLANIKAYMDTINHSKPANLKGTFIKSIHLATTMGPAVKIQK
jgi:large subunit ribosomal protein L1